MSQELLKVRGLKKYFPIRKGMLSRLSGHVKAVDDISFSINEGSTFGLVGESGCGKSTTGRTILNLLEPTAGAVEFNGKTVYDIENKKAVSKEEMRMLARSKV